MRKARNYFVNKANLVRVLKSRDQNNNLVIVIGEFANSGLLRAKLI